MNAPIHAESERESATIMPLLLQHLDAEEAWLNVVLERFEEIQRDLAAYDLDSVLKHLTQQHEDEQAAAVLGKRRMAVRNCLAARLNISSEQVTISGLLRHINRDHRPEVCRRQQELLLLSRRVAAAQASAQRIILHVHGMSEMFLSQLFGEGREEQRYSADGGIERSVRGQLLEVRT